ncbi:MAG: nuclear transport factor 2 family protein [Dyadobacter sp.]|uniref:nuclear transport factor 2 family protein n=1 Tax=Dyadobacter sp. TaxID=1914288 RepID=UPI0032663236
MKRIKLMLVGLLVQVSFLSFSQSADEKAVMKLSALETEAFLKSDTIALEKLWSPAYVVMNPFNKIVTVREIKALIRNSKINQVRFQRVIERITIHQDIATEMGQEIPDEKTAVEGVAKQVLPKRRFTNIWLRNGDSWHIVSRQATNVCP